MEPAQYEFSLLGQKIVIKNKDEADMAEIAIRIVNDKIAAIKKDKPMMGPQQVAVLALLEITGDMVRDRKSIDEYRQELDRKCSSLMVEITKVTHPSREAV